MIFSYNSGPSGSRRLRRWLYWAGLLGLAVLGLLFVRDRRKPPPPKPAPTAAAPAKMEALSLTEVLDGNKRWVLEGREAQFSKDRLEVSIRGVKVEFLGDPDEQLLIKADEGVYNTKTHEMSLKGQVELQQGGLRITTGQVTYNPADKVLLAPDEVALEEPRLRVQGRGLKVELTGKKLIIAQHRQTEIKLPGGRLWP